MGIEKFKMIGRSLVVWAAPLGTLLLFFGETTLRSEVCGPFPDWETSEYVLPYPVGAIYAVVQGNCSGFGHSNHHKHGYDFAMPLGSEITASRVGTIFQVRDLFQNGQTIPGQENFVKIIHEDGKISAYSHLSPGILVTTGQVVEAGHLLGLSGNTGNTGGFPHLHFYLTPCSEPTSGCGTLPVNFRNTRPNSFGLGSGTGYDDKSVRYKALPFEEATLDVFGGVPIDGSPGWNASPWFLNYNVDSWPWIFHDEHGWQYVYTGSTEGGIILWDLGLSQWLFFNESTYRWMFLFGDNMGWIWSFGDNSPDRRFFQRADDGTLFSIPPNLPN